MALARALSQDRQSFGYNGYGHIFDSNSIGQNTAGLQNSYGQDTVGLQTAYGQNTLAAKNFNHNPYAPGSLGPHTQYVSGGNGYGVGNGNFVNTGFEMGGATGTAAKNPFMPNNFAHQVSNNFGHGVSGFHNPAASGYVSNFLDASNNFLDAWVPDKRDMHGMQDITGLEEAIAVIGTPMVKNTGDNGESSSQASGGANAQPPAHQEIREFDVNERPPVPDNWLLTRHRILGPSKSMIRNSTQDISSIEWAFIL
jgi:hypothetical protein